jgi:hypothetical protein
VTGAVPRIGFVLVLDLPDMGTHCDPGDDAKIPLMQGFFTLAKLLGASTWLMACLHHQHL